MYATGDDRNSQQHSSTSSFSSSSAYARTNCSTVTVTYQYITLKQRKHNYRIAGNFRGRKLLQIGEKFSQKTSADCSLVPPKDAMPPNLAKTTSVNSYKTSNFAKVFSLESFPLYGTSLHAICLFHVRRPSKIYSLTLKRLKPHVCQHGGHHPPLHFPSAKKKTIMIYFTAHLHLVHTCTHSNLLNCGVTNCKIFSMKVSRLHVQFQIGIFVTINMHLGILYPPHTHAPPLLTLLLPSHTFPSLPASITHALSTLMSTDLPSHCPPSPTIDP